MRRGFVCPNLKHASFSPLLYPPSARTLASLLSSFLCALSGFQRSHNIASAVPSRSSPLLSVELPSLSFSSMASPASPPAPLWVRSFANSSFFDCSAFSSSALSFLIFLSPSVSSWEDDASSFSVMPSFAVILIDVTTCFPYSPMLLPSTLPAAAVAVGVPTLRRLSPRVVDVPRLLMSFRDDGSSNMVGAKFYYTQQRSARALLRMKAIPTSLDG